MANTLQARKRARQATVHRARNISQRSSMRTSIKTFLKSLENEDKEAATKAYREAASKIDQSARKGLEHRNKAARLKSRLNARLKAHAS
ncbi:MAG TPA: 30S ribosomal protein S20 [Gammaproteobacteria bacterium]|nr:30S ribosomal protein S20 [Gammaproteobacteria bacterium]RTZ64055.1 MAG: 30S ribosomal protein S20 [Gammaproteobacteria bacterium]HAD36288.1 30S ribosomal protein S20 [Gammaproteobacteria bacterium]HBK76863.1 30S ribosomal protein S20 [Gammaproteobacteria bacterium]HHZ72224.1 30S ribosomal protein S20 [Gammaproteobacteria bacterium]